MHTPVKCWIEAMRLRTLPVSIAGVIAGVAMGMLAGNFRAVPSLICFVFALLAQITSNLANEYFDFKNGIDRKGRVGFRRGVTEGDISPHSMFIAVILSISLTVIVGLNLLWYGPLWLIAIGVAVVIFAFAYSAGPYPLSHHGLGDIAVIIFFGVVPVTITAFLQSDSWEALHYSLPTSISIGLLAANVLIVNNYRDMDDDKAVGKHTTVVIFGRKTMSWAYLLSGIVAMCLMWQVWIALGTISFIVPILFIMIHIAAWHSLRNMHAESLNRVLARTSLNLLAFAAMLCTIVLIHTLP